LFLVVRRAPSSALFPYTTLFRSCRRWSRLRGPCGRSGRTWSSPESDARPSNGDRQRDYANAAAAASMSAAVATFAVARSRLMRRSEEHTSELQSRENLVCRLLLE